MTSKPPVHLIRPIIYPKPGQHSGIGAAHRTLEELAAMNDPHNPASGQAVRDAIDEGKI